MVSFNVHVSHPYNRIESIRDLYKCILVRNEMILLFHIVLWFTRVEFALANLIFIFFSLFPSFVKVDPRYFNLSTVSFVSPHSYNVYMAI